MKKGAGILFTDGKQVLLLKRAEEGKYKGYWGLPGGKVEEGESHFAGAQREAREECGFFRGQKFDALTTKDTGHHWVVYFYKVKQPFQCRLSDEHSAYKWVDIDKIADERLHPKFREHWHKYANKLKTNMGFKDFIRAKEGSTQGCSVGRVNKAQQKAKPR